MQDVVPDLGASFLGHGEDLAALLAVSQLHLLHLRRGPEAREATAAAGLLGDGHGLLWLLLGLPLGWAALLLLLGIL